MEKTLNENWRESFSRYYLCLPLFIQLASLKFPDIFRNLSSRIR